jgi:hypothetical protein
MMKILPLVIVGVLIVGGIGAVAIPKDEAVQFEQQTVVSFSRPYIEDKGDYVSVELAESKAFITEPGRPLLPMYVNVFELPFGAQNIQVSCTIQGLHIEDLSKKVVPTSQPIPRTVNALVNRYETVIDASVYSQSGLYPDAWYGVRIGCGLNSAHEHVTHVAVQVYPIRYCPVLDELYSIDSAELTVSYEMPVEPLIFGDSYDMVIIAPRKFARSLTRLIDHKNHYEMPTMLKNVEDIYNEYTGVDKPEQIKYFIKDAVETMGVKYVLLVGGLRRYWDCDDRDNENEGSTDWHVPVRYTNLYDGDEVEDPGFISDLYYADIYKGGGAFENWDSNGDGIFAAWDKPGVPNDVLDLYPDVSIGRLPCRNQLEVILMVNKIINYEKSPANPIWFNKMICVAGDSFPSYFIYEGEFTCDLACEFMSHCDPIRIFASYRDSGTGPTPSPDNITRIVSEGSGFLMFEGHGTPGTWATHYPGGYEWTPIYMIYQFPQLSNGDRLPVCVVGGCHNSMFNVSIYKTYGPENESYWSHGMPIPECFNWWLTRKLNGGSIATIGCTALGYGIVDFIGLSALMDAFFFWAYGEMGQHVLGDAWFVAVNEYVSSSGFIPKLDAKTVEEWELFGDPSLMIGGYTK